MAACALRLFCCFWSEFSWCLGFLSFLDVCIGELQMDVYRVNVFDLCQDRSFDVFSNDSRFVDSELIRREC